MPKPLLIAAAAIASACGAPRLVDAADAWQTYADCAAGYRANWQDRLNDPTRPPNMRDMIRSQADDYLKAAVHRYSRGVATDESRAGEAVRRYIDANLARFIAMDKRDELNTFLDKCPQLEDSGSTE